MAAPWHPRIDFFGPMSCPEKGSASIWPASAAVQSENPEGTCPMPGGQLARVQRRGTFVGCFAKDLAMAHESHRGSPRDPPRGDLPLVVGLDDHGGDQTLDGLIVGEDPDRVGVALGVSLQALEAEGRHQVVNLPRRDPVTLASITTAKRAHVGTNRSSRHPRATL
jgi:hypothetical protein